MIFFLIYIGINILFLLLVWGKYTMNDQIHEVRGFVAHCVRIIDNGEYSECGGGLFVSRGIKTEILVPYGLFIVNTPEHCENTALALRDIACVEFPLEQNWSVMILSSDEKTYLETIKVLKLET